jgi:hypothetical protein
VIFTFSQSTAPPTWVVDPGTTKTLPPSTAPPTDPPTLPPTDPPTSFPPSTSSPSPSTGSGTEQYCQVLNSALSTIVWSDLHPDVPQLNISVPLIGKLGVVMTNLQIQGPSSFDGCTSTNSGSGYVVSFPKLSCKVTNADWDWFRITSDPEHHKGSAAADFSTALSFTVDPNTKQTSNINFNSQDFTIHVDGDHDQWLYSIAFSALGDKVKAEISKQISNALIQKINVCLPDPSTCSSTALL